MVEDSELLRQYAKDSSEAAFTELVRRRIDLVFSVALRQGGGDAQLAEDVTQKVFIAVARKARALSRHPTLGGWLHRAAQFAAIDAVRTERRRRQREQETIDMPASPRTAGDSPPWEELQPMLDSALGKLSSSDRDAVSLRFFEGRTFGEIGRILRLNEDAARKRVDRAVDRLHAHISRAGVTSSTAALALALAGQVDAAAPAALVTKVAFASFSGTAAVGSTTIGPILFHLMNTTKITLVVVGVLTALGIGAAILDHRQIHSLQMALDQSNRQNSDLQSRLRRSERSLAAANADGGALLRAAENLRQTASAKPQTFVKKADIEAGLRRARELAKNGDMAGALKEYLWLFDEGMKKAPSFYAVRLTMLMEIAKLGENYPPVAAALQERRDQMGAQLQAGDDDFMDTSEFIALNKALGDDSRNMAYYDQLPLNDSQRRSLATSLYGQFIADQRYSDAAQAKTYSVMLAGFQARAGATSQAMRPFLIKDTADNIEVLAGVGKIAEAQQLATALLAYDGTDGTRALLQARAVRAGHPDLLTALPNP